MSTYSSRQSTPIGTAKQSSTTTEPNISHPAYKLLSQAHPNDPENTTKVFTDKIQHKPLLLSASTNNDDQRAARRHLRLRKKSYALRHARPKSLSAKEKRELRLYELKPEECRYEIYKGLNRLWTRYVLEVLGYLDREGKVVKGKIGSATTASSGGSLLAGADFHGMEVEVVRCTDVGRVGLKGIVVRETRSTLSLVSDEKEDVRHLQRKSKRRKKKSETVMEELNGRDKVRMIMKKGSVFRVTVDLPIEDVDDAHKDMDVDMEESTNSTPNTRTVKTRTKKVLVFELHGDQLEIRPIERAVKKFKWRPTDNL